MSDFAEITPGVFKFKVEGDTEEERQASIAEQVAAINALVALESGR